MYIFCIKKIYNWEKFVVQVCKVGDCKGNSRKQSTQI